MKTKSSKVVTFGELLLRLDTPGHERFVQAVGGGDAFTAGLIYGMLHRWPTQRTIEFAAAAGCLKHSIPGDFNLVSLAEVEQLMATGESGRLQR